MFRIRAVESPPDAGGLRKVWHRGARHAELVSEIDATGRVARHEFSLFDDVVIWERDRGFVTGASQLAGSTRGAANVAYDLTTDAERLSRIKAALEPYSGRDRIIQHLRDLVVTAEKGRQPLRSLNVVTGNNKVPTEALIEAATPPKPRKNKALVWISIGLAVIALALAVLALK